MYLNFTETNKLVIKPHTKYNYYGITEKIVTNTYNLIKLLIPCSGPSGLVGSNCSSVFTSKRNYYI